MNKAIKEGIWFILFVVALIFLLAGCAPQPPKTVKRIPFPVSEYNVLPEKYSGKNVVTGQIKLVSQEGNVFIGKDTVYLNPVTSYSKQWEKVNSSGQANLTDADPRYDAFIYKTKPENGVYKFDNIPKGQYYVSTFVRGSAFTGKEVKTLDFVNVFVWAKLDVENNVIHDITNE